MKQNDRIIESLDRIEKLLEVQQPRPLTFEEACIYLNVRPATLYKWTSGNVITHSKPSGKKIYFKKSDLDAFLTQHRVKSLDEVRQETRNA